MDSEDDTVLVQLKRRIADQRPYVFNTVRPELVFKAAIYLTNQELYKQHNISLNSNFLQQFQDLLTINNNQEEDVNENTNPETGTAANESTEDDDRLHHQDTLLTAGFLPETGIILAPGEGKTPISLLNDSDLDALAFPTVYGGYQRKFKVPYTESDIAKAEARMHDRRAATNIPKLMMSLCKARLQKLRSKVSIGIRKKVKGQNITVSDLLNENTVQNLIQHNDALKVLSTDRASPSYWQAKQKKMSCNGQTERTSHNISLTCS
ncbi:hypothetical protein ONE63_011346 [Megalurothrips usitatus]|uniref:Uncharacterized protein n=1 Tax=Megalurothrips usitatus TaxID=439358 RepID=A0AAV7X633_9NEOP|nr:hypothetical protein ONE63_011346 [Megalurothrips usitatus]